MTLPAMISDVSGIPSVAELVERAAMEYDRALT